ncbi:hypothetical protein Tco_0226491 [Tanacetum coccineum]
MEALQAREDLMKSIQNFLKKFNLISFRETPKVLIQAWDKFFEVKHAQPEDVRIALTNFLHRFTKLNKSWLDYINTIELERLPAFCNNDDDDDDEEYTIAITPVLPTEEPDNSLREINPIHNEDLDSTLKNDRFDTEFCNFFESLTQS